MATIKEYLRSDGTCPFGLWFDKLNAEAAARIVSAKARLQAGRGDVKPVGEGVSELRIDFGPGYRVYFGQHGDALVVLLAGGTKKGQQADIAFAKMLWGEYKKRTKLATRKVADRKGKK
jgi:putative addiction module killer protein